MCKHIAHGSINIHLRENKEYSKSRGTYKLKLLRTKKYFTCSHTDLNNNNSPEINPCLISSNIICNLYLFL